MSYETDLYAQIQAEQGLTNAGYSKTRCLSCSGKGFRYENEQMVENYIKEHSTPDGICYSTAMFSTTPCLACEGRGYNWSKRKLTYK